MNNYTIIKEENLYQSFNQIKAYFLKVKQPISINVKKIQEKRTSPQLKYYWVLINIIKDWINEEQGRNLTDEKASDIMKGMFFYDVLEIGSKKIKSLKSIADKSETDKLEMKDFIEKIIEFCGEYGIIIPEYKEMK